jgi:hypothetical protein
MRPGCFLVIREVLERALWNPEAKTELSSGNYRIEFKLDETELRAFHWFAGAIGSQAQLVRRSNREGHLGFHVYQPCGKLSRKKNAG